MPTNRTARASSSWMLCACSWWFYGSGVRGPTSLLFVIYYAGHIQSPLNLNVDPPPIPNDSRNVIVADQSVHLPCITYTDNLGYNDSGAAQDVYRYKANIVIANDHYNEDYQVVAQGVYHYKANIVITNIGITKVVSIKDQKA